MSSDLPTHPSQLTPEQARSVEAGPEADRLAFFVTTVGSDHQHMLRKELETLAPLSSPPEDWHIPDRWQISRTPEGAHYARRWLREQGYEIEMREDHESGGDGHVIIMTAVVDDAPEGEGSRKVPVDFGVGGDEMIATTRLLLLLAAERVIEVEGGDE